jgi:hypothetical protein
MTETLRVKAKYLKKIGYREIRPGLQAEVFSQEADVGDLHCVYAMGP